MTEHNFPKLTEAYRDALHAAILYVQQRYNPLGIIASGSIVRGNPGPTSDFDIYVIHDQPFRQRVQKLFNNVPAEIFVNNPASVRSYFAEERTAGRPVTAHMLATGFVILSRDPVVNQLIAEASEWLAKRPDLSQTQLQLKRYLIVDALDNARDLVGADVGNVALFLHEVVRAMVDYRFLALNQNLPRTKEIIASLEKNQPDIGKLVRNFYAATDQIDQFKFAEAIAQQTLGVTGFFEWETAPQLFP